MTRTHAFGSTTWPVAPIRNIRREDDVPPPVSEPRLLMRDGEWLVPVEKRPKLAPAPEPRRRH
jgi:hypothetical protein